MTPSASARCFRSSLFRSCARVWSLASSLAPGKVAHFDASQARRRNARFDAPSALVLLLLAAYATLSSPSGALLASTKARAQAGTPSSLACAVEGTPRGLRAADLCKALGRELGRPTNLIDDARATKRGDALQIIAGDVQVLLVWLFDGHVRAWTRVSKIEAAADQLRFLVRAAHELAKAVPALARDCVQLDPNGGRKMRSPDLSYPWAELRPCQRRQVEVVDPWWLPDAVITPAQSPGGSP